MEYPVLSHADLDRLHREMVAGLWVRQVIRPYVEFEVSPPTHISTVIWVKRGSWFRRLFVQSRLCVTPDALRSSRVHLFRGFANPTGSAFAADCPLWLDARARAVIASQRKE